MHPANLEGERASKLDNMMSRVYRYARDLQSDLVFIPPLNQPQSVPGSDFVIQEKGTRAVAIIKPPAVVDDTARRNNAVQYGSIQIPNGYQPPKQKARAVNEPFGQDNSAHAHDSVHHLSDQPQISPTSQVIAVINANPPLQPLESTDHASMPSMYGVNYIQNHHYWQQTWHNTNILGTRGMGPSSFSPYQYLGQPSYYATPFDQTAMGDNAWHGYAYSSFQDTGCEWYRNDGRSGAL